MFSNRTEPVQDQPADLGGSLPTPAPGPRTIRRGNHAGTLILETEYETDTGSWRSVKKYTTVGRAQTM